MLYGYILYYTNNNKFYKDDIISSFIMNNIKCDKQLIFNSDTQDSFITVDEIKVKEVTIYQEINCGEYYKCNYSSDICLYFNDYNMIISSTIKLQIDELKNIVQNPQYIFLV